MAEGLLGGLLGGEDEAPETETRPDAPAGADAYAIATAIEQARYNPKVAAATLVFLDRQARLLESQTAQLNQEAPLRLHHLHGQSREGVLRRISQRIRLATQIMITLIFGLVGFGALVMLRDAATSNVVVVETFDAPPALASSGISGKVVATQVLDALQVLADTNRSIDKSIAAQGAWSSEVQIEVPETGVSVGELNRLLHQRFGHDLHVAGDLIQAPGGLLRLTVRGDGLTPKSFTGGPGDLPKLATQAAEYAYGNSQPSTFAIYLNNQGRATDALAFLPGAFSAAGSDTLRSKLANIWGNSYSSLNKQAQAAGKWRLAIALDPNNWHARSNLPIALAVTEGEEASWRASMAFERAAEDANGHGPEARLFINTASIIWDMPRLLEAELADAAYNNGAGTIASPEWIAIADTYALMHDKASAARYMASSDAADATTQAEALLVEAYAALDRRDGRDAVPPMEAFWKLWQGSQSLQSIYPDNQCLLGLAYGLAGRLADAEALFEKAGQWNRCYAFRGYARSLAGDADGAAKAWLEGERLAPDLPFVPLYRGLSEAARNQPGPAAADFAAAHRSAPHFADPLKAWGDLLARQGNAADALARYDEALRYAPNWEGLQQARRAVARPG